jgi:hypothetical protein
MESCSAGDLIALGIRLALSASFLVAGFSKLHRPEAVSKVLEFLAQRPMVSSQSLARVVGLAEIVLAFALLGGIGTNWASVLAFMALASLTGLLVALMRMGYEEGCGCFGHARDGAGPGSVEVGRNSVLLTGAAFLWYRTIHVGCAAAALSSIPFQTIAAVATAVVASGVLYGFARQVQRHLIRERRGLL